MISMSARASAETSMSDIARLQDVWDGGARGSLRLLEGLLGGLALEELTRERLARARAERLLEESAGHAAGAASEPPGLDLRLSPGADGDLDGLHEAPPTWMVNRTEPSGR